MNSLYTVFMNFFKKKKTIITHNGSFHADDVFACATLILYFERTKTPYRIKRTRDELDISSSSTDFIIVDVGAVYDEEKNRFDHHQPGGAGRRDNGIPYASFGLVWKKYGPLLCNNNTELVLDIDRRMVQPIDAIDNGMSISESVECGLFEYGIHGIVNAYQNTWKEVSENKKQYDSFIELVSFFKGVLAREIERSAHTFEIVDVVKNIYEESTRKNILEIPYHVPTAALVRALDTAKDVLFVVCRSNENWRVLALRKEACSFQNRKPLPLSWAGKKGVELQTVTGVPDALFCHNARFLAVAGSKEGAWKLAELALRNNEEE